VEIGEPWQLANVFQKKLVFWSLAFYIALPLSGMSRLYLLMYTKAISL